MTVSARSTLFASAFGLATSLAVALPAAALPTPAPYTSPTPYPTYTPYNSQPAQPAPAYATPYGQYVSPAPYASPSGSIPSGTTISATMQTPLDTAKAEAGQGFSMVVTRPYPNGDPGYAGAIIRGHVGDVQRAAQGQKPHITLVFDSIVLPTTGQSSKLTGHVLAVDQKQQSAVAQQAIGAGAGMIVGNILGKALGTNLGGVIGAAGGFAYGNNRKSNFVIPANAAVTLQTDAEVARPQARQ